MRRPFDKLIRDRIPELMDADGVRYAVDVLDAGAFRAALLAKLEEEAAEARAAEGRAEVVKELADVLEVLEALLAVDGIGWDEVRAVQGARRAERGGFEKRLRLRWTERSAEGA